MRGVALAGLLAGLAFSASAHAFERQWHLGGGVGFGSIAGEGASSVPVGGDGLRPPLLGAHAAYGISDYLDLRMEFTWASHGLPNPEVEGPALGTQLLSGSLGVSYKLDVIEWVPYFGVLAGYYGFFGDAHLTSAGVQPGSGGSLGASLILGLDYAMTRDLALGLQLRYHRLLEEIDYFTAQLRVEHTWGF